MSGIADSLAHFCRGIKPTLPHGGWNQLPGGELCGWDGCIEIEMPTELFENAGKFTQQVSSPILVHTAAECHHRWFTIARPDAEFRLRAIFSQARIQNRA